TDIELVSAHATATPMNDLAESRALKIALGERTKRVVVHPFKAVIGHTLGAAGALEALAALDAVRRGLAPAAFGDGELEPEFEGRLLARNERAAVGRILKLSAAFGGAVAALVVGTDPPGAGQLMAARRRGVRVLAVGEAQTGLNSETIAKLVS